MHSHKLAAIALTTFASFAVYAAAPLEDHSSSQRVAKLEVCPKRAPPLIVPVACDESAVSTVSAAALLAELERTSARSQAVLVAEREIADARQELTADRERLAAERIDLDLQRLELEGGSDKCSAPKQPVVEGGNDEVKKLSATVKAMKADKAAAVIGVLDRSLAAQVMRTLARPAAAAIFDRLAPAVAADLMQRITAAPIATTQEVLPEPRAEVTAPESVPENAATPAKSSSRGKRSKAAVARDRAKESARPKESASPKTTSDDVSKDSEGSAAKAKTPTPAAATNTADKAPERAP